MFDSKNIIKIKKLKSGDIIFEINPSLSYLTIPSRAQLKKIIKTVLSILFSLFLPLFSFLDKLAEKKKLVISSVGFGIGLGLSIIVTQRPDTLQAFPVLANKIVVGIEAKELRISELDLYATVKRDKLTNFVDNIVTDELIHLEGSGYLGQNEPVVIADLSSKNLLGEIENISIGDKVVITGKNNGIYKYHVIEIRETEAQYLPHVIAREENSLIIYKSQNLFRTRVFIVIAKPFK